MEYLLSLIFFALVLAQIYILNMDTKSKVKRKAFRWWLTVCGVLAVFLCLVVSDKILLVVAIPGLAGVLFAFAKVTKFCDWCGRVVQTNLPFGDRNMCPRCGSTIS